MKRFLGGLAVCVALWGSEGAAAPDDKQPLLNWASDFPEIKMSAGKQTTLFEFTRGGRKFRAQAIPEEGIRLDGYRFVTFRMRSNDGRAHRVPFYLKRSLGENNDMSYLSHLEVFPEWRDYRLILDRGNELPEKGRFGYNEDWLSGKQLDLGLGGELVSIGLSVQEPAKLKISPIVFTANDLPLSPALAELRDKVMERPLKRPYVFREINQELTIPLVRNGKTAYGIEVADSAREAENFAAEELAGYLKLATGAEFPVASQINGPKIRLLAKDGTSRDNFRSSGIPGLITIDGDSPRALLFGVYDFLEKAVGVRWLMPFEYGEVVPFCDSLVLPAFRDEGRPGFQVRRAHYCSWWRHEDAREHSLKMADWMVKNRFNTVFERFQAENSTIETFYRRRGNMQRMFNVPSHNFRRLIPVAKYGKSNPEFFAFNRAAGKWQTENAQLCVTNVELQDLLAEKAAAYFTANPLDRYFPLFQEDGSNAMWCQCDSCEEIASTATWKFAGSSDRNIYLANQVCRKIREKFPDKGVITFAYSFSAGTPEKIKPIPEVQVLYCYYSGGVPAATPWQTRSFGEIFEWRELTDNLAIYTYHYLNPFLMMGTAQPLSFLFRALAGLEIRTTIQESAENWSAPDAYLIYLGARLAWEPQLDETLLRHDYFDKLYGAGGEYMLSYYGIFERIMSFGAGGKQIQVGWSFFPKVTGEDIDALAGLLAQAKEAGAADRRVMAALAEQEAYFELFSETVTASRLLETHYANRTMESLHAAEQQLNKINELGLALNSRHGIQNYGKGYMFAWRAWLDMSKKRLNSAEANRQPSQAR